MKDALHTYLITDPEYYTAEPTLFKKNLVKALKNNPDIDMACFRDKISSNYNELAKIFIETCKEYKINKILLNSKYKLAKKLGANGVHLNSKQFDKIKKARDLELYVVISCHNLSEIEKAQNNHSNAVSYSPVYNTPNKGEAKGINALKEAIELYEDMDIIALGGITKEEQILNIAKTNAFGFASIRYFISN